MEKTTVTHGGLRESSRRQPSAIQAPMTSKHGVNEVQAAPTSGPVGDAEPRPPGRLTGSVDQSALVVEHLSKRFGNRVAFDDVSFEVGYGEVFGFLGPNGAGKTTTVRTLGTLLRRPRVRRRSPASSCAPRTARPSGSGSRSCPSRPACTSAHRGREPRVLRPPLRAARRPRRASSGPWSGQPHRPGQRSLPLAIKGPPPAGGPGPGPAQRSGRAVPRRADLGPRPGGRQRGPRAHRCARGPRRDDLPHHPPPRGGRAAL